MVVEKTEQKLDDYLALKILTKAEATFIIGDKEFTLKPLVPKKLRMLLELYDGLQLSFSDLKNVKNFVSLLNDKLSVIGSLIFDAEISQDFVDNNFTYPLGVEIWETFLKLNRLENIIPFVQRAVVVKSVEIKEK